MEPIGCPETSVRNYCSTLRNIAEVCRCHMVIWRYRPWFGCVWFGSKQTSLVLYMLIKDDLIFKHQITGKKLVE